MLSSFQLSAMAGLELWSRLWRGGRRGRCGPAGAVDSGSPWVCLAMLLVPLDATAANRWLLVANSLPGSRCCAGVLLLAWGPPPHYCCPGRCPARCDRCRSGRPAGLFHRLDAVMTQKLGSALSVFLWQPAERWKRFVAGLARISRATAVAMIRLCIGLIQPVAGDAWACG